MHVPAQLTGRRIAILIDDGVDSTEVHELRRAFTGHGADVRLISVYPAQVLAIDAGGSVTRLRTDQCIHQAAADHCAIVVPSGRGPHEQLRHHGRVVGLVRHAVVSGKIVATGHRATGLLIPAGAASKRRVTSASHLRSELVQTGAYWSDLPVAQDRGVVTTQQPGAVLLATTVLDELSASDLAFAAEWRRAAAGGVAVH